MAGIYNLKYKQSFSSTDTIVVAHNLQRQFISVHIIIGDVSRPDLIETINPTVGNEENEITITLSSIQSGIVNIYEHDVVNIDARTNTLIESDLPTVQVRRTLSYNNIPTSWTDLTFNTTDVENNSTIIEHNDTNDDDIDIKEDGLYWLYYNLVCDDEVQGRIRIDDSTVIPGSTKQAGDPSDTTDVIIMNSTGVIVNLTAGQKVTVQIQANTSAEDLQEDATFIVVKLQGIKGDKGDPGSGTTIEVQEDDATVQASTDTLNFEGSGVSVTDGGGGKVTATISGGVFGSEFQETSVDGSSSTTSDSFQQKATITTASLPSGTYRIGWYIETANNNSSGRTEVRVQINNSTTICEPSNEAEDRDDWVPFSGFYTTSLLGSNTITLDYRNASKRGTCSVRRARLEIWRVL